MEKERKKFKQYIFMTGLNLLFLGLSTKQVCNKNCNSKLKLAGYVYSHCSKVPQIVGNIDPNINSYVNMSDISSFGSRQLESQTVAKHMGGLSLCQFARSVGK